MTKPRTRRVDWRALGLALAVLGLWLRGCRRVSPSPTPPSGARPTRSAGIASPTWTAASRRSSTPPPPSPTPGAWWQPRPGLRWQWQLTGEPVLDLAVEVVDVDLDVDPAVVTAFHQRGVRVICYISVGSYEDWRADAARFPPAVVGKSYEGWPGERWLDIRQVDALAPIMRARLDACAAKGFDGVEPDNIMAYNQDTGFPITREDNLRYARWLAAEAHARGLAIGLKNGEDLVPDLVDAFDFAIVEEAFYYGFAPAFRPFVERGKAVFAAEYTDTPVDWSQACVQAQALGFSLILKRRELDAWVRFCEP